jgi:DNA polymerase sigma
MSYELQIRKQSQCERKEREKKKKKRKKEKKKKITQQQAPHLNTRMANNHNSQQLTFWTWLQPCGVIRRLTRHLPHPPLR